MIVYVGRQGASPEGIEMDKFSKSGTRSEMKYVRELMRQMETAMKNNDLFEVATLANEAGATFFTIIDNTGHDV
jgi:hypothetical protein